MNEQAITSQHPVSYWRLKLGITLFVISIALPLVDIPMVAAIGLSVTMTASVSGALLIGAEVLGLIAVAVMGKSGFAYIKTIFSVFSNNTAHPRR